MSNGCRYSPDVLAGQARIVTIWKGAEYLGQTVFFFIVPRSRAMSDTWFGFIASDIIGRVALETGQRGDS